jgi:hypothetical protein
MPLGDTVKVHLIHEGSTIRPSLPLDPEWSPLMQLRWEAALASARCGEKISVRLGRSSINGVEEWDVYSVSAPGHGFGACSYERARTLIHGLEAGISACRFLAVRRQVRASLDEPTPIFDSIRDRAQECRICGPGAGHTIWCGASHD